MPYDSERVHERATRLDALCDERGVDAVWFGTTNGVAWLTGADAVVARGSGSVAAAGYVRDEASGDEPPTDLPGTVQLVTSTIEANRFRDEQAPDGVAVAEFPWHDTSLAEAVRERSPRPALVDAGLPAASSDDGPNWMERFDPASVRQPLSPADIAEYRELARTVAAAVEAVCRDLKPGDTEREVASALRVALFQEGIECPVALVGGGERAQKYRHYTPQPVPLGDYALCSVTAERAGLHVSTTRAVTFDPPDWFEERTRAAMEVETAALAATHDAGRAGETAGDVFGAIEDAYAEAGWDGEWRNHHQGGAAGYAGREWKATPDGEEPVHLPMAYAYNPTVQGAKSEDTVLVRDAAGDEAFDVLSATGAWPTATVEGPDGTVSLERPEPLER
jgi:Xaa-Pro aminopeptidase